MVFVYGDSVVIFIPPRQPVEMLGNIVSVSLEEVQYDGEHIGKVVDQHNLTWE